MQQSTMNKRHDTTTSLDVYANLPHDLRGRVLAALDAKESAEASGDVTKMRGAMTALAKVLDEVRAHELDGEVQKLVKGAPRIRGDQTITDRLTKVDR